ncbi:MAG: hypothetical protein J6C65_01915 [Prevotella sp.]|nr:hypothetical protein [Prevotella sp.]MBO5204774.1 hypothetical protein [Prevotella sp.]
MEISREEFEHVLPVATSAYDEVFDKVSSHFERSESFVLVKFFDGEDSKFLDNEKTVKLLKVCIILHAFLSVFRQLDLVLTPTGFGVVGNDQLTPASKQRVDALVSSVLWQMQDAESALLQHLVHVEGWGGTLAAKQNIVSLVYCQRVLCQLMRKDTHDPNYWTDCLQAIREVDDKIVALISAGQYEAMLDHVRKGTLKGEMLEAYAFALKAFGFHILANHDRERQAYRSLIDYLDTHPEAFHNYHSSREYAVIHYEHEQNTPNSPAFFFG